MRVISARTVAEVCGNMHWFIRRRRASLIKLAAGLFLLYVVYRLISGHVPVDVTTERLNRYGVYQRWQRSRVGPGENGAAVDMTVDQKKEAKELYKKEGMNIVASDIVALDRALVDSRSEQ